jgi:hypothetical protein
MDFRWRAAHDLLDEIADMEKTSNPNVTMRSIKVMADIITMCIKNNFDWDKTTREAAKDSFYKLLGESFGRTLHQAESYYWNMFVRVIEDYFAELRIPTGEEYELD